MYRTQPQITRTLSLLWALTPFDSVCFHLQYHDSQPGLKVRLLQGPHTFTNQWTDETPTSLSLLALTASHVEDLDGRSFLFYCLLYILWIRHHLSLPFTCSVVLLYNVLVNVILPIKICELHQMSRLYFFISLTWMEGLRMLLAVQTVKLTEAMWLWFRGNINKSFIWIYLTWFWKLSWMFFTWHSFWYI